MEGVAARARALPLLVRQLDVILILDVVEKSNDDVLVLLPLPMIPGQSRLGGWWKYIRSGGSVGQGSCHLPRRVSRDGRRIYCSNINDGHVMIDLWIHYFHVYTMMMMTNSRRRCSYRSRTSSGLADSDDD